MTENLEPRLSTAVIAERVRQEMKAKGWTAQKLLEALNEANPELKWTASVIANLTSGRRRFVTVDELYALAYVLDVSPIALLVPADAVDDKTARLAIVASQAADPGLLRSWIRGFVAVGAQDPRRYFLQGSDEEIALARHPAMQYAEFLPNKIATLMASMRGYVASPGDPTALNVSRATDDLLRAIQGMQEHIVDLIDESPLSDGPEYGKAVMASREVHDAAVERLRRDRQVAHEAARNLEENLRLYLTAEADLKDAVSRLMEFAPPGSPVSNRAVLQTLTDDAKACGARRDSARVRFDDARTRGDVAYQAMGNSAVELYNLRRMMLIRNISVPTLPPDLAYVDELHPNDEMAQQMSELWAKVGVVGVGSVAGSVAFSHFGHVPESTKDLLVQQLKDALTEAVRHHR